MPNARLTRKLSRIFQPVIEPAQENRIGIQQCFRAEISGAGSISPRNVLPWAGDQVLMFARNPVSGVVAQSDETFDAALHKHVKPARNMQRRNLNAIQPPAAVER